LKSKSYPRVIGLTEMGTPTFLTSRTTLTRRISQKHDIMELVMKKVFITSFGFRHGSPPKAALTVDARELRNPEHNRKLRKLRGTDAAVVEEVRATPGYFKLFTRTKAKATRVRSLAVGCKSGHHRSVVLAEELKKHLTDLGYEVRVTHRDINKL
jgi:RNase adaptor protein for sRNA GlmZ degradation